VVSHPTLEQFKMALRGDALDGEERGSVNCEGFSEWKEIRANPVEDLYLPSLDCHGPASSYGS
jgi:hypothetical protein